MQVQITYLSLGLNHLWKIQEKFSSTNISHDGLKLLRQIQITLATDARVAAAEKTQSDFLI